ncbi:MAG TPA: hypothetical protein VK573_11520, partial [Gemmatimonadales bacterium]|nr:hypothetical protein [Gemmatimonadales bacterium]
PGDRFQKDGRDVRQLGLTGACRSGPYFLEGLVKADAVMEELVEAGELYCSSIGCLVVDVLVGLEVEWAEGAASTTAEVASLDWVRVPDG